MRTLLCHSAERFVVVNISNDGCVDRRRQKIFDGFHGKSKPERGMKKCGFSKQPHTAKCAVPGHPNLDVL